VLRGLILTGLTVLTGCQAVEPTGPLGGLTTDKLVIKSEQVCLPRQSQASCFYKQDPTGKQNETCSIRARSVLEAPHLHWGDPAGETFWPANGCQPNGRFCGLRHLSRELSHTNTSRCAQPLRKPRGVSLVT